MRGLQDAGSVLLRLRLVTMLGHGHVVCSGSGRHPVGCLDVARYLVELVHELGHLAAGGVDPLVAGAERLELAQVLGHAHIQNAHVGSVLQCCTQTCILHAVEVELALQAASRQPRLVAVVELIHGPGVVVEVCCQLRHRDHHALQRVGDVVAQAGCQLERRGHGRDAVLDRGVPSVERRGVVLGEQVELVLASVAILGRLALHGVELGVRLLAVLKLGQEVGLGSGVGQERAHHVLLGTGAVLAGQTRGASVVLVERLELQLLQHLLEVGAGLRRHLVVHLQGCSDVGQHAAVHGERTADSFGLLEVVSLPTHFRVSSGVLAGLTLGVVEAHLVVLRVSLELLGQLLVTGILCRHQIGRLQDADVVAEALERGIRTLQLAGLGLERAGEAQLLEDGVLVVQRLLTMGEHRLDDGTLLGGQLVVEAVGQLGVSLDGDHLAGLAIQALGVVGPLLLEGGVEQHLVDLGGTDAGLGEHLDDAFGLLVHTVASRLDVHGGLVPLLCRGELGLGRLHDVVQIGQSAQRLAGEVGGVHRDLGTCLTGHFAGLILSLPGDGELGVFSVKRLTAGNRAGVSHLKLRRTVGKVHDVLRGDVLGADAEFGDDVLEQRQSLAQKRHQRAALVGLDGCRRDASVHGFFDEVCQQLRAVVLGVLDRLLDTTCSVRCQNMLLLG